MKSLSISLLFALSISATEPTHTPFVYQATVDSCYDGDTYTLDINLGFGITLNDQKIRLAGYNTPEVTGTERPAGIIARDLVRALLDGKTVILRTNRDRKGKYGRWLAEVFIDIDNDGTLDSIGEFLNKEGHAIPIDY